MKSAHHVIDYRCRAKRTSWLHREEPPKAEKTIPAPRILRERVCCDGLCSQGRDCPARSDNLSASEGTLYFWTGADFRPLCACGDRCDRGAVNAPIR